MSNCKKRWKSLRDTFIKYYRLEVLYSKGGSRRKQKTWNFYHDLAFLKQHVDLFRLEEKEKLDASTYSKEGYVEASDYLIEDENMKEVYEIKIAGPFEEEAEYSGKEDHLLETYEEQLDEQDFDLSEQEEASGEKGSKEVAEQFEIYVAESEEATEQTEFVSVQPSSPAPSTRTKSESDSFLKIPEVASTSLPAKNIVDPDERYLMSCLPAFKRFTPQQKAYVRMGIERLFYEVEFENISEPKSKRSRMS